MSRTAFAAALPGLAIAAILANAQPVVMPTRRREFEPDYDLNQLLDDAGKRGERKARKAERKARLRAAQRSAVEGLA
jgi:hypothetical protein